MTQFQNIKSPYLTLAKQASSPDAPDADHVRLWIDDADGKPKMVDESDVVVPLGGYPYGTAFPGSPASGDIFYRTDRNMEYFYDGTRWVTTQIFFIEFKHEDSGFTWPLTATSATTHRAILPFGDDYDVWLMDWYLTTSVATTNNGTNFWTSTIKKFNSALGGDTTIATYSTGTTPDTAGTYYNKKVTINALMGAYEAFYADATKTLSPGAFRFNPGHITCRAVG